MVTKNKIKETTSQIFQKKKNPISSRRWCCFSPHATNLPLASLLLTILSGCGIITQLEIKRCSVRRRMTKYSSQCFFLGQGPAVWLIGPLRPEPSLGFTLTQNVPSEKQTFRELWQKVLRWFFFIIFQSRDWTAQQLSVWQSALSRCQQEICKCLTVIPLYIKVNHADGGQNNSYKVIRRHKNNRVTRIQPCILIPPKAGILVVICELKQFLLGHMYLEPLLPLPRQCCEYYAEEIDIFPLLSRVGHLWVVSNKRLNWSLRLKSSDIKIFWFLTKIKDLAIRKYESVTEKHNSAQKIHIFSDSFFCDTQPLFNIQHFQRPESMPCADSHSKSKAKI